MESGDSGVGSQSVTEWECWSEVGVGVWESGVWEVGVGVSQKWELVFGSGSGR